MSTFADNQLGFIRETLDSDAKVPDHDAEGRKLTIAGRVHELWVQRDRERDERVAFEQLAMRVVAFWMANAALNGSYLTPELKAWLKPHLEHDSRTAITALRDLNVLLNDETLRAPV
jgi:hypothetical protein